jgi:hypothetical protein
VWATGSWEWTSSGWSWRSGQWSTPQARPAVPAPRNEPRGFSPSADATWTSGTWSWNDCRGEWTWSHGRWLVPSHRESAVVMRREVAPPAQLVAPRDAPKVCAGQTAPPEPRADVRTEAPVAGAVWIPGSWHWGACDWSWTAGHWNAPPAPNMVWVPGATVELGRWVVQAR